MRKILLGIMCSAALSACGTGSTTETVTLAAQMISGASSGQSGTATLKDNGNSTTTVIIATTGGTDSGAQMAHIHIGTCGSNGAIYVPLNTVQGGQSSTTVPYALSALQGSKYYINVHNSANPANIQSCGNIQ